jgi:dolichol-phosphate mannosyltransferase
VKLSVVIPARDEERSIGATVRAIAATLRREGISYEIVIVDDASTDGTADEVGRLGEADADVRYLRSPYRNGFGFAVRAGLEAFTGDAVAIMMADGSDDPEDLVAYHRLLLAGYDCAFGSRFMAGAKVTDYPRFKLVVNRIVNGWIRLLFGHGFNDTTNAFKAYKREVIANVQPLVSQHFNLTVEIPLKAVVRGHSYAVVPIRWRGRSAGTSKLRLEEMGSRYLFIVLMVFLEHHLSRGDYRRVDSPVARPGRWRAGRPAARFYEEPSEARRSAQP